MVNMIAAQRAFEVNSKAIKTADEMLQIANGVMR
jgi:flagellar basal-body rod protein FlgG